ncbi:DUF5702 domain-containing protein [Clostridium lacusfryxellense]|uniref:DUF5702 domain-containing protein n=1 Tax=Clostridium lacusfryxellense TaxID=205328 RepID=UPI001C0D9B0D|nr:DUF5702 domain-containing protein [Clostridium lacusfryxellense]MBU3112343.1 hypothetical protein [Clostridium lacusfryxellense]
MSRKTKKRIEGSISIFLVIILVPMICLSGLIVDASRVQLGKSMVASAGDLTMNSGLANYDTVLKDVYGLFAVSQNEDDLSANLEKYFTDTLIANKVVGSAEEIDAQPILKSISDEFSGKSSNLLKMEVEDFTATKVPGSDLASPNILKNQIVEFMKYRAPVNVGLSFLDSMSAFSRLSKQADVTKQKVNVDEKAADFNDACGKLYKKLNEYNEKIKTDNPNLWKASYDKYGTSYETINKTVIILMSDIPVADVFVKKNENADYPYYIEGLFPVIINEVTIEALIAKRKQIMAEVDTTDFNMNYIKKLMDVVNSKSSLTLGEKSQYLILYEKYIEKIALLIRYDEKCKEVSGTQSVLDPKSNNKLKDAVAISEMAKSINGEIVKAKNESDILCKQAQADITKKITFITDTETLINDSIDKMGKALDAAKVVGAANKTFKGSVDTYNTGGGEDAFSSAMGQETKYNEKAFDEKSVEELKKQLEAHKKFLDTLKPILASVTYGGTSIKDIGSFEDAKKVLAGAKDPSGKTYKQKIEEATPSNVNQAFIDGIYKNAFKQEIYPAQTSLTIGELEGGFWKYLVAAFSANETKADEETKIKDEIGNMAKTDSNNINEGEVTGIPASSYKNLPSGPVEGGANSTKVDYQVGKNKGFFDLLGTMNDTVKNLLSPGGFENVLTTGRDNLYVMDYAFNMFSFHTQKAEYTKDNKESTNPEDIKTLSNIKINSSNNAMYGAEVEYLLYGMGTPKQNVDKARGNIFALRFIANSGYALTNAEIRGITLPPALAIQTASAGFIPYKLPQVVMQLCLALAESAADLSAMEAGNKIAILKSNETWVMSPKGGMNLARDIVKDKSATTINTAAGRVKGALSDLIDNTGKKVTVKATDLIEDVRIATTAKATEAVGELFSIFSEKMLTSLDQTVKDVKDGKTPPQAAKQITDAALAEVQTYIDGQADGIIKTIMQEYFISIEKIATDINKELEAAIGDLYNNSSADLLMNVEKKVATQVEAGIKILTDKIGGKLESTMTEYENKIIGYGEGNIDKTADKAIEATNEFFDKTFAKYTDKLPDVSGKVDLAKPDKKGKNSSIITMLKFGYSDYLKMFMFGNITSNDDLVVRRIADVIQINVGNGFTDTTPLYTHKKGAGFRMNKANTYIEINATVKLSTMFMALPMLTKSTKDSEKKAVEYFPIKYKSALGY